MLREVSCQTLGPFFDAARRNGLTLETYLAGLPYSPAHFQTAFERIDWGTFLVLHDRLRPYVRHDDDWVDMGRRFVSDKRIAALASVAKLLASPRSVVRWQFRFAGRRLMTNLTSKVQDSGRSLIVELAGHANYDIPREYFLITKGVSMAIPTLLGAPEVPIDLTIHASAATFVMHFEAIESNSGVFERVRETYRRLRHWATPRTELISEYEQSQLVLEDRYQKLEAANQTIGKQQRILELVNSITTEALKLEGAKAVSDMVVRSVHERLALPSVRLSLSAVVDALVIEATAEAGVPLVQEADLVFSVPLYLNGAVVGHLAAAHPDRRLNDEERNGMTQAAQAAELAMTNAIGFQVISSYRRDLELKVEARTAELKVARDEIARALESRNRFFANVNHELRTPLTVMLLSVHRILSQPELPDGVRPYLGSLQRNGERLQALVDDLMLLSAGNEGRTHTRISSFDLVEVVLDVVEAQRPASEAKGIALVASLGSPCLVEADRRQIDRALSNLVTNALKHTAKGSVRVQVASTESEAILTVEDTGEGMTGEDQRRIFERFFQVPGTQARPGTGIGLALVKEIAQLHRGRIEVRSQPGVGSTFELRIPRQADNGLRRLEQQSVEDQGVVASTVTTPSRSRIAPLVDVSAPKPSRSHRVLVCEDNLEVQSLIRELLGHEQLGLEVVSNAAEALAAAAARPPDLLVTDLDLGEDSLDGVALCREFLKLEGQQHTPVVFLTASPLESDRLRAFALGAVDYVVKPFRPVEFLARIHAQIRLREATSRMAALERRAAQNAALAGLAHELRNPLNGLVNAVAPLRECLPPGTAAPGTAVAELLGVLEDCGRRVADLSHELLFFTRQDPEPIEKHRLDDVVTRGIQLLSSKLRTVDFATDFQFRGFVRCAPSLIVQVVVNLLENAVDAAGAGGSVKVRSGVADGLAFVDVSDSGPGVPLEMHERVFEPFFTTKRAGEGTGLGLSISRDIARRHSGDVRIVKSADGRMAVRLLVPIFAAEVAA